MKTFALIIAGLQALASLSVAKAEFPPEFYIYADLEYYFFYTSHPSCNDVLHHSQAWPGKGDVSGVTGVVCEGTGCYTPEYSNIDRMEINIEWGHATIYKDRYFGMYDLDNNYLRTCIPLDLEGAPADDYICGSPLAMAAVAFFFCTT